MAFFWAKLEGLGEPPAASRRPSGYPLQPLRAFMLRIQSLRRVRFYPSRCGSFNKNQLFKNLFFRQKRIKNKLRRSRTF
jgi:hypothetical protein